MPWRRSADQGPGVATWAALPDRDRGALWFIHGDVVTAALASLAPEPGRPHRAQRSDAPRNAGCSASTCRAGSVTALEIRRALPETGGLTTRARHSGDEMTRAARAGFQAKFEQAVDPGGRLRAADRTVRARSAMRAHMLQLAERSAAVRARRREGQG